MAATRSGIPTDYRFGRFRSRLEARWAAFFDLVGWSWVYEPLDLAGWIPDFLIQGRHPFFVEVGPCISIADYQAKAAKADLTCGELQRDILIVGVTPLPEIGTHSPAAGWLGEFGDRPADGGPALQPSLAWGAAVWGSVWPMCFYHEFQSFDHRPGCIADDREGSAEGYQQFIRDVWSEAGSLVQWHPR